MGQVRNDFGEERIAVTLGYAAVAPGQVLTVPDEQVYHWVAGGWTPLGRYPVPAALLPNHVGDGLAYAAPEPGQQPEAGPLAQPPAPAPAASPVPATTAPASAGSES